MKKGERGFVVVELIAVLLRLTILVGIVYVAHHFIMKYW